MKNSKFRFIGLIALLMLFSQPFFSYAGIPAPPEDDDYIHFVVQGGGCSECGPCTGTVYICDNQMTALLQDVQTNCNPIGTYLDVYCMPCQVPN